MRSLAIQKVMPDVQHTIIKALVVEDDPLVRLLHKRMLIDLNCEVDVAASAEEAFTMLNGNYDVVLLDIELPGMSGIEFSLELRSQPQHKFLRLIALTASLDENIHQQCFSAGINQVLRKPVDVKALEFLLKSHDINHRHLKELTQHSVYRNFRYE